MKILLTTRPNKIYDSYNYFLARTEEALIAGGHSCMRLALDGDLADAGEALSWNPDCILDFNSILPGLAQMDEDFNELLSRPFGNVLLDHPLYHHKALTVRLPQETAICIDREHAEYVRKYYPHIKKVLYLPLPGSLGRNAGLSYKERSDALFFAGTIEDGRAYYEQICNLPAELREVALRVVDRTKDSHLPDFIRVMEEEGKELGLPPEICNHVLFLTELYARTDYRYRLVSELKKSGLPLALYGSGTGKLDLRPALAYEEYVNQVGQYRVALNILPGFRAGLHDRLTTGMRNGCMVLTDANSETEELRKAGVIRLYGTMGSLCGNNSAEVSHIYDTTGNSHNCDTERTSDISAVAEDLAKNYEDFLRDPEAEEEAERAKAYAEEHFTWETWVREVMRICRPQEPANEQAGVNA